MLSDRHRIELESGSGITPGVIEQRGYRTVTSKAELLALGFSEDQARVPALLLPLWFGAENGLYQIKPDEPRLPVGKKKPLKYETPLGAKMRLDVHPSAFKDVMDPEIPLLVTEGLKKGDSALSRGLVTVNLLGVWNYRGQNDKGGICDLAEWSRIPFKSKTGKRKVGIVYDSGAWINPHVRKAMTRLGRMLRGYGAHVVYIKLEQNQGGSECKLDDWLIKAPDPAALWSMAADPESLDSIKVNARNPADIVEDALRTIAENNDPPKLFLSDGRVVRVAQNERQNLRVEPVSAVSLAHALNKWTSWHITGRKGEETPCGCPLMIAETLLSETDLPLPGVLGVTRAPVLNPDGSLSTEPGYCPKSKLFMAGESIVPFEGSAKSAVAFLRAQIWRDFPFASESDFAHAIALALLPVVRPVIDGPTPLHLIDAPAAGTGKTLLGRICLMLTQGDSISIMTGSSSDEEWRKRLSSCLADGRAYVFLDNLAHKIDSEHLAAVLTNGVWDDRRLGATSMMNLAVYQTWVATSNNPQVHGDLIRRSARIHLDAEVERPGDRGGFAPVEQIVKARRPELQGAMVRIAENWVQEERPEERAHSLGSFERWSAVMGGILACAGVPGFLGNVRELREAAGSLESAWSEFYGRWHSSYANMEKSASELWPIFAQDEELGTLIRDGSERSQFSQLGIKLRERVGAICGGLRIVRSGRYYRLETTSGREKAQSLVEESLGERVKV